MNRGELKQQIRRAESVASMLRAELIVARAERDIARRAVGMILFSSAGRPGFADVREIIEREYIGRHR